MHVEKVPTSETCLPLFDDVATGEECETVIVFGMTRGGTSMVAGAVRGFGYYLGEGLLVNLEDRDFVYRTDEHMKETIARRNRDHSLWGWKFPMAVEYLDRLLPFVRNPILVIVTRDLTATACAMTRWDGRDPSGALSEAIIQSQRNLTFAIRHRLPTLYVSYEKAGLKPDLFLTELGRFLGRPLAVDRKRLLRFMSPGSYKSFEEMVLTKT
jgi:hypothetical protein